jgi:DNA-binding LacI/PurR family transcriptional regulator
MLTPTLRQIAALAGVSSMTVSRAIAGRGRIAEATRQRIVQLAREHGYAPDPEIAKLMHHLRGRRAQRFQSLIVGLSTRQADDPEVYFRLISRGAKTRFAERGYGFEPMHISANPADWPSLQRTLKSRGVEGILILPQVAPIDLTHLLDWSQFCVVAASASATLPGAHRVTPHHFANMLLLCRTLKQQGHRRIGLVIASDHDRRTEHGFTAGVTWHGLNEAAPFVPPYISPQSDPAGLRAWFARDKPDVLITSQLSTARTCAAQLRCKLRGAVRFVCTSRLPTRAAQIAGIDERPELIGAAAADRLASMVERRKPTLSQAPQSTLLTGRWVD